MHSSAAAPFSSSRKTAPHPCLHQSQFSRVKQPPQSIPSGFLRMLPAHTLTFATTAYEETECAASHTVYKPLLLLPLEREAPLTIHVPSRAPGWIARGANHEVGLLRSSSRTSASTMPTSSSRSSTPGYMRSMCWGPPRCSPCSAASM